MGATTIVEAKAVETKKGVGRVSNTPREIETETGSVTQIAQEIESGIVEEVEMNQADRKTVQGTEARAGAGIAGIETIETTREIEVEAVRVAETAATETGRTP